MFSKKLEKEIKVEGMHCIHCAKKVEKALLSIKGIKSVDISVESGDVKIISKTEIDNNVLREAIESLGYKMSN